ncbi:GNAT family N-acetyltransferase [Jeotgalibacillus marinus]|uniref:GNAT family N-acetyltransferase n=1 Tax=Jeotgalibacillus marinus TaxID=86667 RepID=A0ABV3Q5E2_9BACL
MISLSVVEDRLSLIDLLLLADDDRVSVENYLQLGTLYAIECHEKVIGAVLLIHHTDAITEIKNIALHQEQQGKGIGSQVIDEIVNIARKTGSKILEVGTANSSIGNLTFYQKCGFRMVDIKRDYFAHYKPTVVENGIVGLDLVLFQMDLRHEDKESS